MLSRYTLEELHAFSAELHAEIKRREFPSFREKALPFKQLCNEEYYRDGPAAAIKRLRSLLMVSSIEHVSLVYSRDLIEEWAKAENWQDPNCQPDK